MKTTKIITRQNKQMRDLSSLSFVSLLNEVNNNPNIQLETVEAIFTKCAINNLNVINQNNKQTISKEHYLKDLQEKIEIVYL